MQDFSSVNIKNMIIHNVGNKVKGESLDLSTEICDTNNKVTNQYLKQFFFSTFKFDITYRFVHETDIAMNEIYNYVKHIFDNSDQFYEQSVNIAKHLYEVSVHPNIKAGELCIVYLQNCIIDDNVTDAVGIYKSESKDYYLQVNSTENGYDIECQQGINPKKLDKGCLIFNSSDSNYKVCVVDKNVNDAMYWKKLFLIYDEYDRLIQLCDCLAGAEGVLDIENRMNDVKKRYGFYPQDKWNSNMKLKQYFEGKMNKDIYIICEKDRFVPGDL